MHGRYPGVCLMVTIIFRRQRPGCGGCMHFTERGILVFSVIKLFIRLFIHHITPEHGGVESCLFVVRDTKLVDLGCFKRPSCAKPYVSLTWYQISTPQQVFSAHWRDHGPRPEPDNHPWTSSVRRARVVTSLKLRRVLRERSPRHPCFQRPRDPDVWPFGPEIVGTPGRLGVVTACSFNPFNCQVEIQTDREPRVRSITDKMYVLRWLYRNAGSLDLSAGTFRTSSTPPTGVPASSSVRITSTKLILRRLNIALMSNPLKWLKISKLKYKTSLLAEIC